MSTLVETPLMNNYTFNFLDQKIEINCYEKDLLFLIDFMTNIETQGSKYWITFNKLNCDDYFDPMQELYSRTAYHKITIPNNLRDHIINYLPTYERDKNIDSVLL